MIIQLFIALFFCVPSLFQGEVINQPVVNIYRYPEENTELNSQAIYGSFVEITDYSIRNWLKIKTLDGVEGWVLSSQVTSNPLFETSDHVRPVKNLFAHIYRVTDTTPYPPILTIPYSAKIKLSTVIDTGERWVPVELVSGEKAWIQRGDVDFEPKLKTLEEMIVFSKKFLGLPYTWGGTSSYGFDCSGFTQMLFKEMGIMLPRNSRNQARSELLTFVAKEDLHPGDLVFFGNADNTRIVHVGLYLGDNEFIHSGVTEIPIVMISNLNNEKYRFNTARRLM